ncbi:outer membrane protein transport protein [Pelagovum pacificum]|uniref:Aromatic hydrocarbon degradation protein n=1 Tax=Pelagovum pacificum TaxID=2588711 RepID=A0A5C5GDH2_9RHOB|nr:outer membrane protein transport protein [Pelagovum pacificum]QQA44838.1 hypothetical protein I8N54_09810 [Pelagovum pacificum]TNY32057.1 hypothetical protein FHY64_01785 [Pelagovum pacificum]
MAFKRTSVAAMAALLATTSLAHAGGIDRLRTPLGLLFEDGSGANLTLSYGTPDVSGTYGPALGGGSTGDMAGSFINYSFTLKTQLNDRIGLMFTSFSPYGANADYMQGPYTGLSADWDADGSTILASYRLNPNFIFYGGARITTSQAEITIPDTLIRGGLAAAGAAGNATAGAAAAAAPAGSLAYSATTEKNGGTSYIAGAAYERPDIALRVGLTYESGYTHEFETVETLPGLGVSASSVTEIDMPSVVTLDFQTGVAADTLVFGSIRHATWSDWHVRPQAYDALFGEEITGFDNDVTTYQVGVGRQFSDALSGFARVTYEAADGETASRLAPTDGTRGIGVGMSYDAGGAEFTMGVEYQKLGDATDASGTEFEDNDALGVSFGITSGF